MEIGEKFNKWTVIDTNKSIVYKNGDIVKAALCSCSCGKTEKLISEWNLINNKSKGCIKCNNKKYNVYDLTGEYGIGYTFKNEPFYFDLEDYDKIKDYCWHYHSDDTNNYVRTRIDYKNNKNIYSFMHTLFLYKEKEMDIDHMNGITYDNRKQNLRVLTHADNMKNTKTYSNTKHIKGVHFSKIEKKWKAYITCNGDKIHLGTFLKKEDAIIARLDAEKIYFKDIIGGRYEKNNI